MRTVFNKALSVFLALVILIATAGAVVTTHVCTFSKKATVSLYQHRGCCSEDGQRKSTSNDTAIDKKCCNVTVSYYKVEVPSGIRKVALPFTNFFFNAICIGLHSAFNFIKPAL